VSPIKANPQTEATEPPPLTIAGFCKAESMSRAFFYAMQRRGMGPQVTEIILPPEPGVNRGRGLRLLRIYAAAHREWRQRIAESRATAAGELEAARARAQRAEAAKLAVASPKHVSKRPRPAPQRRRRR
jgi:hypothetical protein